MIYLVRLAFFILIINLFSNALNSQDLTFDVNYASDEVLVGADSVGVFYGSIINTSSENINIRILRSENVTNLGWTSSICIGSMCYSNWVDSVNVNIVNGDSADFSIYVWTNGQGESSIELELFDIEFPNDLLQELDRMEFYVYETKETIKATTRPIVIISSNNEKELPDAFLRRCFFHYISFPDRETMKEIIKVHHPKVKEKLVKEALDIFFDVRKVPGLKKKPSTSELVDWLKLLMADDLPDEILKNRDPSKAIPPLYGALVKNEQDVQLLERLAFMTRREGNNQN